MIKRRAAIGDLKAGEVAKRLGLSRSYVHELIKGNKTPSLEVAVKIEREFGVPLAQWAQRIPANEGDHNGHGAAA